MTVTQPFRRKFLRNLTHGPSKGVQNKFSRESFETFGCTKRKTSKEKLGDFERKVGKGQARIGGRLRLDAATLGRMLSGLGDPFGDG